MKRILFLIAISVLIAGLHSGCRQAVLSENEIALVWSGEANEPLPVLTIHHKADSLFLREPARKIKPKHVSDSTIQHLKKRMYSTVTSPKVDGIGIAAPQVGVGIQMIYVQRLDKTGYPFEVFFNPEIIAYGDSINSGMEGCLSVPFMRGNVERSHNIDIAYLDSLGNRKQESISGFTAVIFQHEIDHLNGVLYFDHIFNGFEALIQIDN